MPTTTSSHSTQITCLLLDLDNALVFSEELAFEACAELTNEILAARGIPNRYTGPELMEEFVGQNFRGMLIALKEKFQYEMDDAEKETYVTKEEDQVIQKINERLRPCPGAKEELQKLANKGKYRMVVVSSSAKRRAIASLEKVGLEQYFLTDDIFSAATSLPVPTSKPDPAIYLHALEVLGKKREECVAVEDSKSGVMSSARAGIKCVGYVGSYAKEKQENMAETLKNAGACSIMKDWTELDYHVEKIEKGEI